MKIAFLLSYKIFMMFTASLPQSYVDFVKPEYL